MSTRVPSYAVRYYQRAPHCIQASASRVEATYGADSNVRVCETVCGDTVPQAWTFGRPMSADVTCASCARHYNPSPDL